MPLLTVNDLTKSFVMHTFGEKVISGCTGASMSLEAGQFVGITGKSGAGKSTVLKCVYRTYLPTSGQMLYESAAYGIIDLATAPDRTIAQLRRRELGYVSQFLRVLPRVTAIDIVSHSAVEAGVPCDEAMDMAAHVLRWLQVDERLWDAYPTTFSGGEKLRLNVAQSVVKSPRILLLDEPTASLDEQSKGLVRELLQELKSRGTAMLGIFHDLDFMKAVVDVEYRMVGGVLETRERGVA